MKIGVFMPGRLDSERLPNKLILPLGKSNLWDMACEKLSSLPIVYDKYVLVYDQELIDIAAKYDNIQIIIREKVTTQIDGPLVNVFAGVKDMNSKYLMFLNPCLSFLTAETITDCLFEFSLTGQDYATSVKSYKNWVFEENHLPIIDIDYQGLNTKTIDEHWEAAHCFHIFNREEFLNDGYMLKDGCVLLEVPKDQTIDVDTPEDYEYAKFKHAKRYVIDIDETICSKAFPNYQDAQPYPERIERVNDLYRAGNYIIFNTARGWTSRIDWREVTEKQLKDWGVHYHELHLNKPAGDIYIDDKGIKDSAFFK